MILNTLFKHLSRRLGTPGAILREKYEAFKLLLSHDIRCHEQMAEFQELLHGRQREDFARIRKRFALFSDQVDGMVDALETMNPGKYVSLKSYHKKFDFYTRFLLAPPEIDCAPPFVLALDELTAEAKEVGNKAGNLAVLKNELAVPVPGGFAVTINAFHRFIEYNNLRGPIDELLSELNIESTHSLDWISVRLKELISREEVPPDIAHAILAAYDRSMGDAGRETTVAVRSSARSEDGECSFAGQYETLLGVSRDTLLEAYRKVLASKYAPEALFYRITHGLADEATAMSVLVQEMVSARCSGVLYTREVLQETEEQGRLHLYAVSGLGERLVGGASTADHYVLTREEQPVLVDKRTVEAVLSVEEAMTLSRWGMAIETYFGTPQDIEWAMDETGAFYIVQARPLHISSEAAGRERIVAEGNDHPHAVLLAGCERASAGVAVGVVYRLDGSHVLEDTPVGAVLVTRDTPPEYVRIMNRLSAVLAERGSRASHFATVAREFGVPLLVNIAGVANRFEAGREVTVDGDKGLVYDGRIKTLIPKEAQQTVTGQYHRTLHEVLKFITPLELIDPTGDNFKPEGCRSMHDIIRFCHEKAVQSMFSTGKPGSGRGSLRLIADMPLDVFLFDVGGGIAEEAGRNGQVPLAAVLSIPFLALWQGLSHPGVRWKQKPFDWDAYGRIELAGGLPPPRDSFALASYAVIGRDYLHFNIRFGYHFTIVDALCGESAYENYCMLRFAGGGGDFAHRSLRIDFINRVLEQLDFQVEKKGDLLEARLPGIECAVMEGKLDLLGRLLGSTRLMDMVLVDEPMVKRCVEDFFAGRYSFTREE